MSSTKTSALTQGDVLDAEASASPEEIIVREIARLAVISSWGTGWHLGDVFFTLFIDLADPLLRQAPEVRGVSTEYDFATGAFRASWDVRALRRGGVLADDLLSACRRRDSRREPRRQNARSGPRKARAPGSRSNEDDSPEPPLAVIPVSAFLAELDRVLGEQR